MSYNPQGFGAFCPTGCVPKLLLNEYQALSVRFVKLGSSP